MGASFGIFIAGKFGDVVREVLGMAWDLCRGDFGTSFSCQLPGIKANGTNQVAVSVTP